MASASSSCLSFSASFVLRPSKVGRPASLTCCQPQTRPPLRATLRTCFGSVQCDGRWSGLTFASSASLAASSSRICDTVACSSPCSASTSAWCSRSAEYAWTCGTVSQPCPACTGAHSVVNAHAPALCLPALTLPPPAPCVHGPHPARGKQSADARAGWPPSEAHLLQHQALLFAGLPLRLQHVLNVGANL